MIGRTETAANGTTSEIVPRVRKVHFEYSQNLPGLFEELRAAILVSTCQAGKLGAIGARQGQLTFAFHDIERVLGVAVGPQRALPLRSPVGGPRTSVPNPTPSLEVI